MTSIVLPRAYGLILADLAANYALVHFYMPLRIGQARKKYDVPYPTLYAPKEHKNAIVFNCIQRGHQNTLESNYMSVALMLAGGLKFPVVAAAAGAAHLIGRLLYFQGYSTGDPKKRTPGAITSFFSMFALAITTGVAAYSLLA